MPVKIDYNPDEFILDKSEILHTFSKIEEKLEILKSKTLDEKIQNRLHNLIVNLWSLIAWVELTDESEITELWTIILKNFEQLQITNSLKHAKSENPNLYKLFEVTKSA